MKTKEFGPTHYSPTVVGLGGMPLSIHGRPERDDAVRVIHAALDAGMTLIDTADVYCLGEDDIGHNEQLIARALWSWSGDADSILVCTKGGLIRPKGEWVTDGRPEHLADACDRSLSALGVDRIAVYQLHAPDPKVPFLDSVGALARLKEQGKIEHVGLSNVSAKEIDEANAIVPIVSVQNRCNPFDLRAFEDGVIAKCEALGLAFLPWSPVGGGRGKGKVGGDPVLEEVGRAHGRSAFEVAIAWLLRKSDAMFPIPGASREESARSSAAAADLALSDDEVARVDAHVGFPAA
jgi:aryl-alcohol dehydrogenase-like predicted oxidoreductase